MADMNLERECEQHLSWMWQPYKRRAVQQLSSFAKSPDSAIRAIRNRAEASFRARHAEVGDEGLAADLMLDWVPAEVLQAAIKDMPARLASERARFDKDPMDAALAALFEKAAVRLIGGPFLPMPPPCRQGQRIMHITARRAELSRLRGETRARAALALFGCAFEKLYKPWLLRLWILTDLADGIPSAAPGTIGSIANRLEERNVSRHLLIQEAVHVRNAATHDHATFDVDSRRLQLWDHAWRQEYRSKELEHLIDATLGLQQSLTRVTGWFFPTAMHRSGVAAATFDYMLARRGDAPDMPHQVAKLKAAEASLFEPMRAFIAQVSTYEVLNRLRAWDEPIFASSGVAVSPSRQGGPAERTDEVHSSS